MSPVGFKLPASLEEISPSPQDQQIVIVSFFGKSSYLSQGCKTSALDDALGRRVFNMSFLDCPHIQSEIYTEIKGFYETKQKVLYLHLSGTFDIKGLTDIYEKLKPELAEKGFLKEWAQLRHNYARSLLYLFCVSHVLVCTHPSAVFDASYIRLFRALDSVRQKVQGSLSDLISTIPGVPKDWVQYGRLCTPRLLFLFEKCPVSIRRQNMAESGDPQGAGRKIPCLKKLEHAMEDQIYHVLRKNRIISKSSMNSLFAIPANQEFVFIPINVDTARDWRTDLIDNVINLCNSSSFGNEGVEEHSFHSPSFINELNSNRHSFKGFLQQHIDQAFLKGFDDNVGRHSSPTFFQVPKLSLWLEVSRKMFEFFISQEKKISAPNQSAMLYSLLDTDVKFSESRCGKVLPLAIATYQDNLPTHYTREYHEGRLAHALSVFAVHARGPLFEEYAGQVEAECKSHWKAGRQMCQVLSLTGNPCTKPLHRGGGDGAGGGELQEEDGRDHAQLPLLEHSSGVVYVSACNCGRKQGAREDPFSMRTANHDFYSLLGKECGCADLESIGFPVFTPSTKDFRAAQLFSNKKNGKTVHELRESEATTPQGNTQGLSFAFVSGQSGESDLITEETSNVIPAKTDRETDNGSSAIVIQVSDGDSEASKEKGLVRQPSTTEYLPGMLHSESPLGLLPQFPSWSLVCLGPSSLYSHNLGLQEQQHAGLISGSAYLLPWDLTVRLEHQQDRSNVWPTVGDAAFARSNKPLASSVLQRPRKPKRDTPEFVVKIFVGVEYECPRGHRFMCSAPDKVLKTTGSGLVKDNGNKITGNDMPLYFPCPCKNSKPLIAQLMRVHVVTPKAPVHVTLNPKVQPAPSPCPIFGPGCDKPIRLSQSAYWILRLPYVYVGDQGPYVSPKEPVPIGYGRLLAGMYGIMELSPNEKA